VVFGESFKIQLRVIDFQRGAATSLMSLAFWSSSMWLGTLEPFIQESQRIPHHTLPLSLPCRLSSSSTKHRESSSFSNLGSCASSAQRPYPNPTFSPGNTTAIHNGVCPTRSKAPNSRIYPSFLELPTFQPGVGKSIRSTINFKCISMCMCMHLNWTGDYHEPQTPNSFDIFRTLSSLHLLGNSHCVSGSLDLDSIRPEMPRNTSDTKKTCDLIPSFYPRVPPKRNCKRNCQKKKKKKKKQKNE
jgi:hypothetical protein